MTDPSDRLRAVAALRDEWLRVARENEVTPEHATSLEWRARELTALLDAVPDVPPTEDDQLDRAIRTALPTLRFHNYTGKWAKGSPLVQALSILSEHVGEGPVEAGENVDPEVITAHSRPPTADAPPDPPAVDRDELARVLHDDSCSCNSNSATPEPFCHPWGAGYYERKADAMFDEGVLVDAAYVRARAASELRAKAVLRFDEHGPDDARGAAIWDCAAWLTEAPAADDVWSDPLTDTSEDLARLAAVREVYEHCKAGHYSGASHQLIEHLGNALDGPPAEDAATGGTT